MEKIVEGVTFLRSMEMKISNYPEKVTRWLKNTTIAQLKILYDLSEVEAYEALKLYLSGTGSQHREDVGDEMEFQRHRHAKESATKK